MIVVTPMERRPDEKVEDFILRMLDQAAYFPETSARAAAPKALGSMGTDEEAHVAAYKQGFADGFNEARDLAHIVAAGQAGAKP